MSKLNRKEFKELLAEWNGNFLNENRIIPLAELINIIRSNEQYTENDADQFIKFWNSNQFSSKYSQVIKNDLEKGEPISHIITAVIDHYNKIYQGAGIRIKSDIGSGSYSVDDLRKDLDARTDSNKFNKKELRQQCQYQNSRPVVGKYKDFDVVYSESDWIVIEPKTTLGSIAWAHGKPDGSEETDQDRRVGWCTGTSSGNNMFTNYAGNLHMFYLIRSDYENVSGPERRICLAYMVNDGKATLQFDRGATVDANNKSLKKTRVAKLVNKNILNLLDSLVSARKETAVSEIYSKITASQLKRQIAQMKSQGINSGLIEDELNNYANYAKSKDVVDYFLNIGDDEYKCTIARREDLLEVDPSGEIIMQLASDESKYVRSTIAGRKDLLEVDPSGELIIQLASDKDSSVKGNIARTGDLLGVDPSGELLMQLADDENPQVRTSIAIREDLLEIDPSGEIIRQLASDKSKFVRVNIAKKEGLLEVDPLGEIIMQLASDEDQRVRSAIAGRKDLLEVDPSGEIIIQLAIDEKSSVRSAIAGRKDLLEVDPSGELIMQLASDVDYIVKATVANRKDLLELDSSGEIIRQLASDEKEYVRQQILNNEKYIELLNKKTNETVLRNYIKLLLN